MNNKKIGIAADHGGFELKEFLKKTLHEIGYEVIDFGNHRFARDDDYPDVEDDNMNILCLGGRIMGQSLALEITKIFLSATFSGAERHLRRVAKVAELEFHKGED